jgi:cellulose synthase/poly-beta-1,6-N-acetylglucosamine synthase-like glycosyltransferase
VYTIIFVLSIRAIYTHGKESKYWSFEDMAASSYTPPLSIIVPCHNEALTIVDNINALLSCEYREFQLVIVNDGSTDETMEILTKEFNLNRVDMPYKNQINTNKVNNIYLSTVEDNIIVLDKDQGGKADALNAGINVGKYSLITAIDADSIIESDSLLKVVRPFVENPDVIVSGGIVRPVNDSIINKGFIEKILIGEKPIVRFQIVEYLRAFLFGRIGLGVIDTLMIISGAFGVFNKEVIIDAGGYTENTIGEDMELIVKIHRKMKENRKKYRIVFVPSAVCWTQVPEDLRTLKNQRKRWQKGLMDTMLNHMSMLLNPEYGTVGLIGMPYFFFIEMLGPVIEVVGYLSFFVSFWYGIVSYEFAVVFFGFAVVYGIFLSIGAILLDEFNLKKNNGISDYLILITYSILENFGYRQLTTWWRFIAFWQYKRSGNKWGAMKRKSFSSDGIKKE